MTAGGQTAGDQAVRDRALDIHGSFIVQAPAGSGKTELLIQRYLNLLAHVREPEEIVAITFTRKAASEMRERIIATLRRAADDAGECDGEDVAGARLALARRAIANDRRRGWQLVSHPARLQIQTIDALCLSLTRQLPWLSGFAAPSGILDDSRAAYRRAAMETIRLLGAGTEDWRASLERFMVHVDNDMASATGLLSAMLASRDQWLRYLGGEQLSRTRLEAAWREVVDSRLERLAVMFPAASKSSLVACADAAAEHLAGSGDDPGARAWLAGDGFPQPEAAELPRWRFMADLLLTRSGQWRRKVNKNQGFPPQTEAKRAMQALLDSFAGDDELARRLAAVETLPAPGFSVEQAGVLDAMVAVLKLAVAQLQVVFEETGQVDFVEVALRAQQALGGLEEPSDLALKLDYRIAHLLVDEFQDTSLGQHRLLQLLTQG
ncbi:MAG TPA: UvrD-helicase domain-containing protein, partial [Arenicellales bacterium]|nr:UvrD-helicase domain-containing protein [Arenicellales bacterium]